MKKIILGAAVLFAFSTATYATPQTTTQKAGNEVKEGYKDVKHGTSKAAKHVAHNTKQGYKHTRHDVKQGYKNTRSDVKAGVDAAKENKENR